MSLSFSSYKKVECLGYSIFNDDLIQIDIDKKIMINTINQYSYCIAESDGDFKRSLLNSDILLPDGVGIVAAAKFLRNSKVKKIAGADIHHHLLQTLNKKNGSCFYMGSSTKTLEKIEKRMKKDFPNIRIGTYSPPYKDRFSDAENDEIIKAVNQFAPDVLFVGMTAPKQEKWSNTHKDSLNTNVICSIGAVFDFYAGTVKRPGKIWQNLGLEWLGRLIKEPKRMYKRYIYYGVVFGNYLLKSKLKGGIA